MPVEEKGPWFKTTQEVAKDKEIGPWSWNLRKVFGSCRSYTGKLADLAKHDVVSIIDKVLREDAKYFDIRS